MQKNMDKLTMKSAKDRKKYWKTEKEKETDSDKQAFKHL